MVSTLLNSADVSQDFIPSDWPSALMLDEVWLRVHRVLVHQLEALGLWVQTVQQSAFMQEQKTLGEQLKHDLLSQVLDPADYLYLSSESVFGASNQRFRSRLPLALAFGYELGSGLYHQLNNTHNAAIVAAHNDDDDDDDDDEIAVAELCSIFNLGISVFDLVYDHSPDLFEQFSQVFNEDKLKQLQVDSQAFQQVKAEIAELPAIELRILLSLIVGFFAKLQPLKQLDLKKSQWNKLSRLLLEAYRAELNSTSFAATEAEILAIAQAKSTLPFAVLDQIARLVTEKNDRNPAKHHSNSIDAISKSIATHFWLIDDLVDVVADLQAGALNSILVQVKAVLRQAHEPLDPDSILSSLLTGRNIENTVEAICTNLAATVQCLESDDQPSDRLRQVVLSYTRNWME
jgi:hypothetical protein